MPTRVLLSCTALSTANVAKPTARATAASGPPIAGGVPADSAVAVRLDPRIDRTQLCVAVLDARYDPSAALPTLMATLTASGGSLAGSDAAARQFDPLSDYRHRTGRFVPLACGLMLCFFSVATLRFRSAEIAVYRLSGTRRADMLLIACLEQVVLSAVFATAAIGGALLLAGSLTSAYAFTLQAVQATLIWMAVFPLLACWLLLGNPTDLAKER